ncbi:hypothetical protein [Streptomyces sp. NPDC005017]|uniref:hypothetical protein n=1 Tax=Streptomyces sp. NPDC005017 TaxID=3364706 RepID=UPI0036BF6382
MTSGLTYGVATSPHWVRLPIGVPEDDRSWAKATASRLAEGSRAVGFEVDQRSVRKDLRARLDDSRQRDPLQAFLLYPDGFDTALATMELDLIHPDDAAPVITLEWLAKTFSADDFGPPQITHTELPAGEAVRVRQNFAAGHPPPGSPGILVETLTYGVLPPGTRSALMMLVSWTAPGISALMEEESQALAETLSVEATTLA